MLWDAKEFIDKIDKFKLKAHELIRPFIKQRILDAIDKVCTKKEQYAKFYEFTNAYRASNQVDRPMNNLDKYLFNTHYFHGHLKNADLKLRAWALIHNFKPFCKRSKNKHLSRYHQINKLVYYDFWLGNLLNVGKKLLSFILPNSLELEFFKYF
jgi:hypothetical protein